MFQGLASQTTGFLTFNISNDAIPSGAVMFRSMTVEPSEEVVYATTDNAHAFFSNGFSYDSNGRMRVTLDDPTATSVRLAGKFMDSTGALHIELTTPSVVNYMNSVGYDAVGNICAANDVGFLLSLVDTTYDSTKPAPVETDNFQRAGSQFGTNNEGLLHEFIDHEIASSGFRNWRNLVDSPDNFSATDWIERNSVSVSGQTLTAASTSSHLEQTLDTPVVKGGNYVLRLTLQVAEENQSVLVLVSDGVSSHDIGDYTATSTDEIEFTYSFTADANATLLKFVLYPDRDDGDRAATFTNIQIQDKSGQADTTTPDEYAPRGTAVGSAIVANKTKDDWVPTGTNVFADDSEGVVSCTFGNSTEGGNLFIPELEITGKMFIVTGQVKVNTGSVNVQLAQETPAAVQTVTSTSYVPLVLVSAYDGSGSLLIQIHALSAGETIYIKDLEVYEASTGNGRSIYANANTVASNVVTEIQGAILRPQVTKTTKTKQGNISTTEWAVYEPYKTSTAVTTETNYIAGSESLIPNGAVGDGVSRHCVKAGTTDATEVVINTNRPGDSVTPLITTAFDSWSETGTGTVVDNSTYYTMTDTDTLAARYQVYKDETVLDDSLAYCVAWEVQKPTDGTVETDFQSFFYGGTVKSAIVTVTWAAETISSDANFEYAIIVPHATIADRFYILAKILNNSAGNTNFRSAIFPAGVVALVTGSIDVYGFNVIKADQPPPPTLDFATFTIDDWEGIFTVEDGEVVWSHSWYTIAGWLAEAGATNILLQSNDLSTTWTNFQSVDTQNQGIFIDGTNTFNKITDNSGGGTGLVSVSQTLTITSATDTTFSAYCKADQLGFVRFITTNYDAGGNGTTWFNLSTKAIGTTASQHTAHLEILPNGIVRCGITFQSTTDVAGTVSIGVADADNDSNVDLDGTSSILVGGIQVESSSFPTSYIPTTTTSESRESTNTWPQFPIGRINNSSGSILADYVWGVNTAQMSTADEGLISSKSGTATNELYQDNNELKINDGTNSATVAAAFVAGESVKVLSTWDVADGLAVRVFSNTMSAEGTDATYDGSFGPSGQIESFISNAYPILVLNLVVVEGALSAAERAAQASFD